MPLHYPIGEWGAAANSSRNVALTAHVLIALERTAQALTGTAKTYGSQARHKAIKYLEKQLVSVRDPYEIALVAYALSLARSSEADTAHGMLLSMKREDNGMVYWSRTKIINNRVRYEYNRPFLEPKDRQVRTNVQVYVHVGIVVCKFNTQQTLL